MGYIPCRANDNVYMKAKTKPNGDLYWSYILVYVDDLLVVDYDADAVMERIKRSYTLKGDTYSEPDRYLGGNIGKYRLNDGKGPDGKGTECWYMSSDDYLQEACKMVRELSEKDGRTWNKKRRSPFYTDYRPETDTSEELGDELASRY